MRTIFGKCGEFIRFCEFFQSVLNLSGGVDKIEIQQRFVIGNMCCTTIHHTMLN